MCDPGPKNYLSLVHFINALQPMRMPGGVNSQSQWINFAKRPAQKGIHKTKRLVGLVGTVAETWLADNQLYDCSSR